MKWSLSSAKTFRKCQRQWYFRNVFASPTAKDPERRAAFLLGKLQSVASWRGSVVDEVISGTIVGSLKSRQLPERQEAIAFARKIFDMQLATAKKNPLREPDMPVASWGRSYAALFSVEYGDGPTAEEIETAWREVVAAIENLLRHRGLLNRLLGAKSLFAQRPLQYQAYGVTVVGVPDLIAFYENEAPAIIDWKAHAVGSSDAWLQLAIYAGALVKCTPHKDFPENPSLRESADIRLLEVQLLIDRIRNHELDDEDRAAAEDYIADSASTMLTAIDGRKLADMSPDDFSSSPFDGVCADCSFKRICWETNA
ncbi:PD-(D/E)XK nuclease family protein [Bradyrhizobium vignae]|uniref:PD-(D/E)XK endonuclease-like domain-containing protein n=1 Tax=Bradyrhizobium vignae TaxID=1549949 RepID=A0A2U3PUF8_9BRAD|nr:PD-(D/E)XK nuclease family protein [Bradyrhizobium vignae]SPP92797.1 conserved protein of unknown function [Bradyrhizobium vignae]